MFLFLGLTSVDKKSTLSTPLDEAKARLAKYEQQLDVATDRRYKFIDDTLEPIPTMVWSTIFFQPKILLKNPNHCLTRHLSSLLHHGIVSLHG